MRLSIACRSWPFTWRSAMPRALFASSMSPIAAILALDFETREPSTRPVSPASPVRV